MKIIDVITSRLLLIYLEISGNIKFPENSQPYVQLCYTTHNRTVLIIFRLIF